jgi:hypothetical protein
MVNGEDPVHAAIAPGRTAGRTAAGTAVTAADSSRAGSAPVRHPRCSSRHSPWRGSTPARLIIRSSADGGGADRRMDVIAVAASAPQ